MSKPETIHDLVRNNLVSLGQVRSAAKNLFDGQRLDGEDFEGYVCYLPQFDDLPSHIQDFIVKGLLSGRVANLFDDEKLTIEEVNEIPEGDFVAPDDDD